jgi:hypothetical protein
MRFLWPVAGNTFRDQKRSVDMHSELQVFNLTERRGEQKENWRANILRMTMDRRPKIFLKYGVTEISVNS